MSLSGKDEYPYLRIGKKYYSSTDVLLALGKALVKKGLLTKSDILAEL